MKKKNVTSVTYYYYYAMTLSPSLTWYVLMGVYRGKKSYTLGILSHA
jgi:hypothetical protein